MFVYLTLYHDFYSLCMYMLQLKKNIFLIALRLYYIIQVYNKIYKLRSCFSANHYLLLKFEFK